VGRQFYNNLLGQAVRRLQRMRHDPRWAVARALPHTDKQARTRAFGELRQQHGFSEYALHGYATAQRVSWLRDHLDAHTAQTLATRAYRAVNRVALGKARRVRFRSKGRPLSSLEGKSNQAGITFRLDPKGEGEEGNQGRRGHLRWHDLRLEAIIDWDDEVIAYGLSHRIKYARLLRRPASSPRAKGADALGYRYAVQLVLEGVSLVKERHTVGEARIGLDVGPSTIAMVPLGLARPEETEEPKASLEVFCEELQPDEKALRRFERQMDRQRRANNPDNYDAKGRAKKGKRVWRYSKRYQAVRRRVAERRRKLAAHRRALHGKRAHEIVVLGNTIVTEKISYKAWQGHYGRSVQLRAPGLFVAELRRIVARTGGTLLGVPTRTTKLSQFCHGCGTYKKKKRSERMHICPCGIGPVQRDLYSAFLAALFHNETTIPSCAQYSVYWEGLESVLRAAHECLIQRAREGQVLPQSMGVPRTRARRLESSPERSEELPALVYRKGRIADGAGWMEPMRL
jgi:hypothetical protein